MRLQRHPANPVLRPDPERAWEAGSVLNGTVVRGDGDVIHMLYRATNDVHFATPGEYVSSIGLASSKDGVVFERAPEPLIVADQPYEQGLGCEDPRVVRLGDTYYIYYTAVEGIPPDIKVRIALATTEDFRTVTKHGVVGPKGAPSKAASLFPELVGGKYLWFFTWCSDTPGSTILHARVDDLAHITAPPAGFVASVIEDYDTSAILIPGDRAELVKACVRRGPELGAPPIRTDRGWLMIYCPADQEAEPEWHIGAVLLDLEEPWRVLGKTPAPLLRPETQAELEGVVNRVAFPSGALVIDGELHVYYGGGDQEILLATCDLAELLDYLEAHPVGGDGPWVG